MKVDYPQYYTSLDKWLFGNGKNWFKVKSGTIALESSTMPVHSILLCSPRLSTESRQLQLQEHKPPAAAASGELIQNQDKKSFGAL